ncbi:MAG: UDP-N-acetylmuramoylalanyl-D-glutamyl-2,6-diaminopimelate--D-alanyl-D-alanine ligase [Hyphomicrobiales bacterium]|nr:MAG: UDP-N-acetylmuramoylalanyl-D-glutamyl-2,6-diaminopimelate--D-alanyl-D-alanine ligase [Hyphomicrobiales bacterium]
MTPLWRSDLLCAAMNGRPVGTLPEGVTGISIDSRTLAPGDAFFAIRGDRVDGHDFATAAVKAGAGLLVVAEGKLPALGRITAPMIVVPDVLAALEAAGIAARARTRARIVAVTGSVGKTTTKEALRVALSACGTVHAADRSFNNHWGVPLTLARMPEDCDYAVFEIGMNHPGEIRALSRFVRPHIAVVTLIAPAHLGHFSSLEEIARAKAEIFEAVEPGGHALVNRDDRQWKLLDKAAQDAGVEHVWSFGEHARSTFRLASCMLGAAVSRITVAMAGREVAATIGAPGRHIVQNALAVLGAAYLAGADVEKAAAALAGFEAEKGRGRQYRLSHPAGGEFVLIDESYNANPVSMRAALAVLGAMPVAQGGRRIAVLGDMLELGEHSQRLHAGLARALAEANVERALLGGPQMAALAESLSADLPCKHRDDAEALKPLVLETVQPGDVVMVKASNGAGFTRIVAALLDGFPAAAGGDASMGQV